MAKVGVIGVPGGWSTQRLSAALAQRGALGLIIDPAMIRLDLEAGKAFFQDHELTAFDALVVKKLGASYSPLLLDRVEMLRFIASRGVPVFSRPEGVRDLLNRLSCTTGLALAGLPLPPTTITEQAAEAARAVRQYGQAVLKPLFSSKARGMLVVRADQKDLEQEITAYQQAGNQVLYVQKFLSLGGRDLGLTFLGGRYLATYARVGRPGAWNTTTQAGGRYEPFEPSPGLIALARRAQDVFGLDFTCVDIAETENGPVVFEVSAFGGFRGLLEGCSLDAAALYAEHVLARLEG